MAQSSPIPRTVFRPAPGRDWWRIQSIRENSPLGFSGEGRSGHRVCLRSCEERPHGLFGGAFEERLALGDRVVERHRGRAEAEVSVDTFIEDRLSAWADRSRQGDRRTSE